MTRIDLFEFEFAVQHNHRAREYAAGARDHFTREDIDMLEAIEVGREVKPPAPPGRQHRKPQ